MREDGFDEWRMNFSELDEYVQNVEKARKDHPKLTIKLALEVDYIPGHEEWIKELAARHKWDYFIGSVHYVSEKWDMDNPAKLSEWKKRDPFEVWSVYFDRLAMAARSRLFDIIGHADLCKKFCFYPKEDCTELFRHFLDAAQRGGCAIEINTAGLRKDCKEMYPSSNFLALAHEYKIPLTFGSDAHAPGEVGMNFAEAITMARRTGYTHWRQFTGRKWQDVKID
jgi:histidinol-phosphatase (PHP family)